MAYLSNTLLELPQGVRPELTVGGKPATSMVKLDDPHYGIPASYIDFEDVNNFCRTNQFPLLSTKIDNFDFERSRIDFTYEIISAVLAEHGVNLFKRNHKIVELEMNYYLRISRVYDCVDCMLPAVSATQAIASPKSLNFT